MFRTKTQRKKLCGACPIAKVADIVGDHWTILIVRDLLTGSKRFGDLEASLLGVSSRTLSKKLDVLEACGILTRKHFSETPPRVEYSLTKKGRALDRIAEEMRKYGEAFL